MIWNSLLKQMNQRAKNKRFWNLIKKIFTDIQPKFIFQLDSVLYDPKLFFSLYLSHKMSKYLEWTFWRAYTKQGNTTETSEILWAGYWLPTERQISSCLFRRKEMRDKLFKTKRFLEVWRHFQIGRSQVAHDPSRQPSHLNRGRVDRRDSQSRGSPAKLFDSHRGAALIPGFPLLREHGQVISTTMPTQTGLYFSLFSSHNDLAGIKPTSHPTRGLVHPLTALSSDKARPSDAPVPNSTDHHTWAEQNKYN